MNKRIIGILLSVSVFLSAYFLNAAGGPDESVLNAAAVLVLGIILWVTEPIPSGAGAVLMLFVPSLLGISDLKHTLASFASPVLFFVIATFGFSAAISKVPLAKRILLVMIKAMGSSINMLILAFMTATALISSLMSNIPATLMFMSTSLSLLTLYDNEEDKRKTGRALMICLPVSGMLGGSVTPAGSSNNLLALSFLEEFAGVSIGFLDWIIICLPIVLIMLPFAWFMTIKIFKPVPIKKDRIDAFIAELEMLGGLSRKEKLTIAVISSMVVLWIMSAWIPALDITVVAVSGLAVMFLPGIELFTWEEFQTEVSWSTILMIGCVHCIGSIINSSGIAAILSDSLFRIDSTTSFVPVIFKLAAFMCIMQIILPNGPAAISAVSVPVMMAAVSAGIAPALLIIPLCIYCSWSVILPLNPVPMLTYSAGYYKLTDIGKVGIPVLILLAAVCAVWLPFICGAVF